MFRMTDATITTCCRYSKAATIFDVRRLGQIRIAPIDNTYFFKRLHLPTHFSSAMMLSNKPLVFASRSRISCRMVLGSRSGASSARFGFFTLRS